MKRTTLNILIIAALFITFALAIFYLFFYDKIVQNNIKAQTISTISKSGVPLENTREYSNTWSDVPELLSLRKLTSSEDGGELMSVYHYADKQTETIFLKAITANDYSVFKYYYKYTNKEWTKIDSDSVPKNIRAVLDLAGQ